MHITIGLGYGGMEMMLARLIKADRGVHEHWVIGMMDDNSPDPADSYAQRITTLGARAFSLGFPRGRPTISGLVRLWRIFRECQPALLSGWNYHGNLAAVLLSIVSWGRINAICNVRCGVQLGESPTIRQRFFFRLHATSARLASAVIFNSRQAAGAHERRGYPGFLITVIPNGFDTEQFQPDLAMRNEMRTWLGIKPGQIAVGAVGRFHPDKDHKTFLSAAHLAAAADPNIVFVIAGTGTEAIMSEPALAALIEAIGTQRVKIVGHVSNMPPLYNALDMCVLSSTTEGFPNVIGEAMACGVPCVSTDVGDVAYLIDSAGIVCPRSDAAALAQAMITMAAGDVADLKARARRRIINLFTLDDAYRKFLQVWQRVIGSPAAGVAQSG
jgi:glycosyltransferase involved in cell wall biosynthesis